MKSPDLTGIQREFRHVRMSRHDAFAKRFFERLDQIALVKRPKGRGDGQRASGILIDRMTLRAVGSRECAPSHCVGINPDRRARADHTKNVIQTDRNCHPFSRRKIGRIGIIGMHGSPCRSQFAV